MRTALRRDERGAATAVEAAVILPALVAFIALVAWLAQLALSTQAVEAAASQAARSASLERSVPDARLAAAASVRAALRDSNVKCADQSMMVDASGIRAPIGSRASVRVRVTCRVANLLVFPGFPSTRTVIATGTSPVDTYRGR